MNPGSDEAIEAGCVCPVLDNVHGLGSGQVDDDGNPLFWLSGNCPLHSAEAFERLRRGIEEQRSRDREEEV